MTMCKLDCGRAGLSEHNMFFLPGLTPLQVALFSVHMPRVRHLTRFHLMETSHLSRPTNTSVRATAASVASGGATLSAQTWWIPASLKSLQTTCTFKAEILVFIVISWNKIVIVNVQCSNSIDIMVFSHCNTGKQWPACTLENQGVFDLKCTFKINKQANGIWGFLK